ncbi:MAG: class D sortase [Ruminococcaceae bacterium]|nr:class D sortase [Oscillospiraceae bacterium]
MKETEKKPIEKQRRRPLLILINILILALILVGAYLLLEPKLLHWQQDRKSNELLQAIESGDAEIVIGANALLVPGEENEFVEEVENWTIDETPGTTNGGTTLPGNPTGPDTTGTTGTSNEPGTNPGTEPGFGTGSTTAGTQKPANVVIKGIGTLIIDKINLKMPIADRAESAQLRVAVGLLGGSSQPGTPGYSVILGHRMYTRGRHFNRLDEVTKGTEVVILTKAGRKLTYVAERQATILPSELRRALSQSTNDKELILVTCTPVRIASHRLLVYARQVSDEAA